jgi:exopolysaccharide production protein ExoQ
VSPQLALLGTYGLIGWLLRRDVKRRTGVSHAVWIVAAWFAIFASRPFSSWFQGQQAQTAESYLEGSPLDAMMFFGLILAGAAVLARRSLRFGSILSANRWLFLFFGYCAISVVWSDYPFVAFKRWFKDFGNIIMVLVLLTEEMPVEAIKAAFIRCASVLVPLSFVFVRYMPELGRTYTGWNKNDLMYIGVATHKNTLGALLLISCVFLFWDMTTRPAVQKKWAWLMDRGDTIIVFLMAFWLLLIADSATSILCTVLSIGIFVATGLPLVKRRLGKVEVYAIVGGTLWYTLDSTLGLSEMVVGSLGRDMTLTSRTGAWDIVLASDINPLVGAGFKSFWAGERMVKLWIVLPHIVQAHNGYVETYLNGGIIGVTLLVVMLIVGFYKIKKHLVTGDDFSRMRLALWVIALFYNFSEAAFNQLSLLWCVTLLVIVEGPARLQAATAAAAAVVPARVPRVSRWNGGQAAPSPGFVFHHRAPTARYTPTQSR